MASESKIKVVNPVVELDGDEVRNTMEGQLASKKQRKKKKKKKTNPKNFCPSKTSRPLPFYSINLPLSVPRKRSGPFHKPDLMRFSPAVFSPCLDFNAGKYGGLIPMCQWPSRGAPF
jgi:hypothetical protein